eukprot:1764073-Rhodomonas_salina.3
MKSEKPVLQSNVYQWCGRLYLSSAWTDRGRTGLGLVCGGLLRAVPPAFLREPAAAQHLCRRLRQHRLRLLAPGRCSKRPPH